MRQQKLSQDQKDKLIKEHSYSRPDSYIGPDYYDMIAVVGQHRDSEAIDRSNFTSALELLGGESDTVQVIRDGHWAVGWIETLRVNIADTEKLDIALNVIASLEDYPVLDEDNLSEIENEEREEWSEQTKGDIAMVLINLFGLPEELSENEEFLSVCSSLSTEHQYNYGNDSSLPCNQYHTEKMDEYDFRKYEDAIKNLLGNYGCYYRDNESFKLIASLFNINIDKAV